MINKKEPLNEKELYVGCGFNKWGIGINPENGSVVVSFNRHPHYGKIELCDISTKELRTLSKVFLKYAQECDAAYKVIKKNLKLTKGIK